VSCRRLSVMTTWYLYQVHDVLYRDSFDRNQDCNSARIRVRTDLTMETLNELSKREPSITKGTIIGSVDSDGVRNEYAK
jgi:hypothetical protein